MVTEAVNIKGDKEGIKILINATFTFPEILQDLERKFHHNYSFFEGASITVQSSTLEALSEEQFAKINEYLETNFNVKCINSYKEYVMLTDKEPITPAKFLMGNVRSGQHINFAGHIVITGDVNAAAQVEADGNICVMGIIKGTVHAGFSGDRNAFIICKQFRAPQAQIRIANLIVRAEQETTDEFGAGLELAHIENDTIVVLSKE